MELCVAAAATAAALERILVQLREKGLQKSLCEAAQPRFFPPPSWSHMTEDPDSKDPHGSAVCSVSPLFTASALELLELPRRRGLVSDGRANPVTGWGARGWSDSLPASLQETGSEWHRFHVR